MPEVQPTPPKEAPKYLLPFEPVGEFTPAELFIRGAVRARFDVGGGLKAVLRNLSGEEVEKVNKLVKPENGKSIIEYNTEVTYHNLAFSVEEVNGQKIEGAFEDKLKRLRVMAAPILSRLSQAYIELHDHIDEMFSGKEGKDVAKKS